MQEVMKDAMKKKPWLGLLLVVVIGIMFISFGCQDKEETIEEKVKPVKVLETKEDEENVSLEYIGLINSQEVKKYSFKVAGKIAAIPVEKGDRVKKGQVLAQLDKKDLSFAQEAAELNMQKAFSAYQDALDFYQKMEVLYEKGAVTQNEYNKAKLNYQVQEATYNQAAVDNAHKLSMLNDADLVADIDGYVVDTMFEEGEVIAAGYPVVVVRSETQIVNTGLSQEDVKKIGLGTKAVIKEDGFVAEGIVTNIEQVPDKTSRTYNVEIELKEKLPEEAFYLGSTVEVFLDVGKEKGIWIPITCIMSDGEDYVYVVENERAVRKNITMLNVQGNYVKVEGLKPGENLVTTGMKSLNVGCKVAVK